MESEYNYPATRDLEAPGPGGPEALVEVFLVSTKRNTG